MPFSKKFSSFIYILALSIFVVSLVYSIYNYTYNSNLDNVPELTSRSQLNSEFIKVKIESIDILPIYLESVLSKNVTILVQINPDSDLTFIVPADEGTIENGDLEVGSTKVFGVDYTSYSSINDKKFSILRDLKEAYPERNIDTILYSQGDSISAFVAFKPLLYGIIVAVALVGFDGWTKTKREEKKQKKARIIAKKQAREELTKQQQNSEEKDVFEKRVSNLDKKLEEKQNEKFNNNKDNKTS